MCSCAERHSICAQAGPALRTRAKMIKAAGGFEAFNELCWNCASAELETLDALEYNGFYEYIPFKARMSAFWRDDWLSYDITRNRESLSSNQIPHRTQEEEQEFRDRRIEKQDVLRYFQKTCAPSTTVTYEFTDRDVSNWDVAAKKWAVTKGAYAISVGSSSQDIRLTGSMTV